MSEPNSEDQLAILKLTNDLKQIAAKMTVKQARLLVDHYYLMQEQRLRAAGQVRSMPGEPHEVLERVMNNATACERQVAKALEFWADSEPMAAWASRVVGIGPILAATLSAHIDVAKCATVGHVWRFAGYDPTQRWVSTEEAKKWIRSDVTHGKYVVAEILVEAAAHFGRTSQNLLKFATTDKDGNAVELTSDRLSKAISRRPHNAGLKTACWKIGESFVKVKNNPASVYGRLYTERRAYETKRNEAGELKAEADKVLSSRPGHAQAKTYKLGRLPDGHLHSRAKRWTVKIFLSHWWEEAYRQHYHTLPPKPFSIEHEGHVHYIDPEVPFTAI